MPRHERYDSYPYMCILLLQYPPQTTAAPRPNLPPKVPGSDDESQPDADKGAQRRQVTDDKPTRLLMCECEGSGKYSQ